MKVAELREIIADLPDSYVMSVIPNERGGLTIFADDPAIRFDLNPLLELLELE